MVSNLKLDNNVFFLGLSNQVLVLLVVAVFFTSIGGIAVASILKYLDNIVKEYTGSVANILTAVVSR